MRNEARFCDPASVHTNTNPLPQPPQLQNFLPLRTPNRRFHSPQQERTNNPHTSQMCAQNPLAQRLNINSNVRKLRHLPHLCVTNLDTTGTLSRQEHGYPVPIRSGSFPPAFVEAGL